MSGELMFMITYTLGIFTGHYLPELFGHHSNLNNKEGHLMSKETKALLALTAGLAFGLILRYKLVNR